jgi:hypothetical protein
VNVGVPGPPGPPHCSATRSVDFRRCTTFWPQSSESLGPGEREHDPSPSRERHGADALASPTGRMQAEGGGHGESADDVGSGYQMVPAQEYIDGLSAGPKPSRVEQLLAFGLPHIYEALGLVVDMVEEVKELVAGVRARGLGGSGGPSSRAEETRVQRFVVWDMMIVRV